LLLPVPLVSSLGMLWLMNQSSRVRGFPQNRLFTILALGIAIVVGTLVFAYTAPDFRYFAEHGPSFVTCNAS